MVKVGDNVIKDGEDLYIFGMAGVIE